MTSARLFALETNVGFARTPVELSPGLLASAAAFGVDQVESACRIEKPGVESELFQLSGRSAAIILRSAPSDRLERIEQQCRILDLVPYPDVVKPWRTAAGRYTHPCDSRVWTAYREQPGSVFSGTNGDAIRTIAEMAAFEVALGELGTTLAPREVSQLQVVEHHSTDWEPFLSSLPEAAAHHRSWAPALGDYTRALLRGNRPFLAACLAAAEQVGVTRRPTLTHNDLHHANVLVDRGRPFFLDLEDVCFEDVRLATGHAVFKLLRHAVFAGAATAAEVRMDLVPRVVQTLAATGVGLDTREQLFAWCAYRTLSDIWEIARHTMSADDSQLYDFEKRIHNLFELPTLIGGGDGPSIT